MRVPGAAERVLGLEHDETRTRTLIAQMMIDKQRALDLDNYIREGMETAGATGQSNMVRTANLVNAFRREQQFNDRAYTMRKQAVERLLQKKVKDGRSVFQYLRDKGETPERIDQYATFLLYGAKLMDPKGPNHRDNYLRDANGDPIPTVPPIPGISNIVNNQ